MSFDVTRIKAERKIVEAAGKPVVEEAHLNLTVRAPSELVAKFRELSSSDERSVNGQIIYLMRQYVKAHEVK